MKYRFTLTYTPTDGDTTQTRTCYPLYNDDLAIDIERENDEWYYTRKLDGNLTFVRDDYAWMMACPFDGTFTLNIQESHDNGATYYDYFSATFSRASLEIDEDNQTATLNSLKEGVADLIKNGAKEEYDLMKLIPDSQSNIVQGLVKPALALVDECSTIKVSFSDLFCDSPLLSGGYNSSTNNFWNLHENMNTTNQYGTLQGILAEAKVMGSSMSQLNGHYSGECSYELHTQHGSASMPDMDFYKTSLVGDLHDGNGHTLRLSLVSTGDGNRPIAYMNAELYDGTSLITYIWTSIGDMYRDNSYYSPLYMTFGDRFIVQFHYIYSSVLYNSNYGVYNNILNTSNYYKGIDKFKKSTNTLFLITSTRTSDAPNGYRVVPGSGDYGGIPQYFAPPDDSGLWIPLAQANWNYASMWYMIYPTVSNYLADPSKYNSFVWSRCWSIGTCIRFLLQKITNNKVLFDETQAYSQFLYSDSNPVADREPFLWFVTQKSNVMTASTSSSAARCVVKLDWFLELLKNAFNCYYWMEKNNDGTYNFRIEHVEYFRRGGAYSSQLADRLDLTRLKPYRNFLRHGQPAKRYADQTNRYTFDLENMVEKYTYSWQGDGGGDEFKGNPMYFRAGWVEKSTSEDHQVDNIFSDLGWLMLNAATDTESSKNYDGLFLFGAYKAYRTTLWNENGAPLQQILSQTITDGADIWLTAPDGYTITATHGTEVTQYIGITGKQIHIPLPPSNIPYTVDFGANYSQVTILRIHSRGERIRLVPNVQNMLRPTQHIQNGVLAWPWLQCEYLHYDIPARQWTYKKDEYTDDPNLTWETDGTIKLVKKQTIGVVPVHDATTENAIMAIMGVKTGLGIGIIDSAKINLSSRNAEMELIYDINPQNN